MKGRPQDYKNNFYRKLRLDKETKEALKAFKESEEDTWNDAVHNLICKVNARGALKA